MLNEAKELYDGLYATFLKEHNASPTRSMAKAFVNSRVTQDHAWRVFLKRWAQNERCLYV